MVGKRLAQCLNPVLPSGVHLTAIEVLELLFVRIGPERLALDLSYFTWGLFQFYGSSTTQVKKPILKVIEDYIVPLNHNLVPCLSSLMVGLLPGCEEPNADHFGQTVSVLDKICKAVTAPIFFRYLWQAILVVPAVRHPGLYLASLRFPKPMALSDATIYLTSESNMSVNAIIVSLLDTNIMVQRTVLDLLIAHFPLDQAALSLPDRIAILSAALKLLVRKENSILRRFYLWILNGSSSSKAAQAYFSDHVRSALVAALEQLFRESTAAAYSNLPNSRALKSLLSLGDKPFILRSVLDGVLYSWFALLWTASQTAVGTPPEFYRLSWLIIEAVGHKDFWKCWFVMLQAAMEAPPSSSQTRLSWEEGWIVTQQLVRFAREHRNGLNDANYTAAMPVVVDLVQRCLTSEQPRVQPARIGLEVLHYFLAIELSQTADIDANRLQGIRKVIGNLSRLLDETVGGLDLPEWPQLVCAWLDVWCMALFAASTQRTGSESEDSWFNQDIPDLSQRSWWKAMMGLIESDHKSVREKAIEAVLLLLKRPSWGFADRERSIETQQRAHDLLLPLLNGLWDMIDATNSVEDNATLVHRLVDIGDLNVLALQSLIRSRLLVRCARQRRKEYQRFCLCWSVSVQDLSRVTTCFDCGIILVLENIRGNSYPAASLVARNMILEQAQQWGHRLISPILDLLFHPSLRFRESSSRILATEYDADVFLHALNSLSCALDVGGARIVGNWSQTPLAGRALHYWEDTRWHLSSVSAPRGKISFLGALLHRVSGVIRAKTGHSHTLDDPHAHVRIECLMLSSQLIRLCPRRLLFEPWISAIVTDGPMFALHDSLEEHDGALQVASLQSVFCIIDTGCFLRNGAGSGKWHAKALIEIVCSAVRSVHPDDVENAPYWIAFLNGVLPFMKEHVHEAVTSLASTFCDLLLDPMPSKASMFVVRTCALLYGLYTLFDVLRPDPRVDAGSFAIPGQQDAPSAVATVMEAYNLTFQSKFHGLDTDETDASGEVGGGTAMSGGSDKALSGASVYYTSRLAEAVAKMLPLVVFALTHVLNTVAKEVSSIEESARMVWEVMMLSRPVPVFLSLLGLWDAGDDSETNANMRRVIISMVQSRGLQLSEVLGLLHQVVEQHMGRSKRRVMGGSGKKYSSSSHQKGGEGNLPASSMPHAHNVTLFADSKVRETIVWSFLSTYLSTIPKTSMKEGAWEPFVGVIRTSFEHSEKASSFPAILEIIDIFVKAAPPISEKKVRKELQDVTQRLVESCLSTTHQAFTGESATPNVVSLKGGAKNKNKNKRKGQELSAQALDWLSKFLAPLLDAVYDEKESVISMIQPLQLHIFSRLREKVGLERDDIISSTRLMVSLCDYTYTLRSFRRQILDIFMDPGFFDLVSPTLPSWLKLMDMIYSLEKNALSDLIVEKNIVSKVASDVLQTITIQGKGIDANHRCRLLRRISFILFAGAVDQYVQSLALIQTKLVECLKATTAHGPLLREIFLCMKMLLLRMSFTHIRPFWPVIMYEVIRRLTLVTDPSVACDAWKVVEASAAVVPREFYAVSWVFMVDFANSLPEIAQETPHFQPIVRYYAPNATIELGETAESQSEEENFPLLKLPTVANILQLRSFANKLSTVYRNSYMSIHTDVASIQAAVSDLLCSELLLPLGALSEEMPVVAIPEQSQTIDLEPMAESSGEEDISSDGDQSVEGTDNDVSRMYASLKDITQSRGHSPVGGITIPWREELSNVSNMAGFESASDDSDESEAWDTVSRGASSIHAVAPNRSTSNFEGGI